MAHSPAEVRRAIRRRIMIIAAITVAVEVGLLVMTHFAPVTKTLFEPVYVIVGAFGLGALVHALRRDPNSERRRQDRRRR